MAENDCNTLPSCNDDTGDLLGKNTAKCDENLCSENSDLVTLTLINKSIGDKLTELSNVMDTFQSSMQSFCEEEGERFDIINDQMDTLVSNNTECCETINSKLEELGSLIEIMDIGDIAPIGYTTTTT